MTNKYTAWPEDLKEAILDLHRKGFSHQAIFKTIKHPRLTKKEQIGNFLTRTRRNKFSIECHSDNNILTKTMHRVSTYFTDSQFEYFQKEGTKRKMHYVDLCNNLLTIIADNDLVLAILDDGDKHEENSKEP